MLNQVSIISAISQCCATLDELKFLPALCDTGRYSIYRGGKWLTSRLLAPGLQRAQTGDQLPAAVQSPPNTKTNQGLQRAIFTYHLSSEHNIQLRGQISQWRERYVKILLEVGKLGGGFRAPSGIRPTENELEEPRWTSVPFAIKGVF